MLHYYLQLLSIFLFICSPMTKGDSSGGDGGNVGMPGGKVPQDVNREDIKELATKGLAKINHQSNSAHHFGLAKIEKAESQVVSGVLYTLTLRVGKTDCLKTQVNSDNLAECNKYTGDLDNTEIYTVEYWLQPWRNFEQVTITKGQKEE
uniref:Cystatin domain-containing protein n=1 Tax=Meloidogyne incognita TaxID=6306 RepID=A0A914LU76_MELIC